VLNVSGISEVQNGSTSLMECWDCARIKRIRNQVEWSGVANKVAIACALAGKLQIDYG